jgi:hypothetical protein
MNILTISTARRRGSALFLAVGLVAVMSIGGAALWRYLQSTLAEARRAEITAVAQHLAEAGLEKAVASLRENPRTYRGEENTPLGRGRFSVSVEQPRPGEFIVIARGEMAETGDVQASQTLRAALTLSGRGEARAYHWAVEKRK